jgi:hypothetical protein
MHVLFFCDMFDLQCCPRTHIPGVFAFLFPCENFWINYLCTLPFKNKWSTYVYVYFYFYFWRVFKLSIFSPVAFEFFKFSIIVHTVRSVPSAVLCGPVRFCAVRSGPVWTGTVRFGLVLCYCSTVHCTARRSVKLLTSHFAAKIHQTPLPCTALLKLLLVNNVSHWSCPSVHLSPSCISVLLSVSFLSSYWPHILLTLFEHSPCHFPISESTSYSLFQSGLLRSCPVRCSPVQSGPVWFCAVRSGPVRSGLVRSGPVVTGTVQFGLVLGTAVQYAVLPGQRTGTIRTKYRQKVWFVFCQRTCTPISIIKLLSLFSSGIRFFELIMGLGLLIYLTWVSHVLYIR